jgi:hypothetical protein
MTMRLAGLYIDPRSHFVALHNLFLTNLFSLSARTPRHIPHHQQHRRRQTVNNTTGRVGGTAGNSVRGQVFFVTLYVWCGISRHTTDGPLFDQGLPSQHLYQYGSRMCQHPQTRLAKFPHPQALFGRHSLFAPAAISRQRAQRRRRQVIHGKLRRILQASAIARGRTRSTFAVASGGFLGDHGRRSARLGLAQPGVYAVHVLGAQQHGHDDHQS